MQSTALSLEDREAAYQAARERIFSDPLLISEDTTEHKETQRVRPVPIVARRMIAHALGKPSVLATALAPNEMVFVDSLSLWVGEVEYFFKECSCSNLRQF